MTHPLLESLTVFSKVLHAVSKMYFWMHVPKAGTAFVASVMTAACPRDILINRSMFPDQMARLWRASFDETLRTRCDVHKTFTWRHVPLPLMPASVRKVIILRHPEHRVLSGYLYRMHGLAWKNTKTRTQILSLREPFLFYSVHQCGMQARLLSGNGGLHTRIWDSSASVPSYGSERQLNVGLRYLARGEGDTYSAKLANMLSSRSPERVEMLGFAKKRLSEFWFVGFTERWKESIDRFHELIGLPSRAVEYATLKDTRVPSMPRPNGTHFYDWVDAELYEHARLNAPSIRRSRAPRPAACC